MSIQKFGKTSIEIDAEKLSECRHIVKNIVNFGVTEAQKLQLIYLLAIEMESREALEIITKAVKEIREEDKNTNFNLTEESLKYNNEKDTNKSKIIVD
jgi:exoribonuclease R